MTEREKIIALLEQCAEPDGDFGIDNAITFYHAAQKEAFEQAAKLEDEFNLGIEDWDDDTVKANRKYAEAIRQLIKE